MTMMISQQAMDDLEQEIEATAQVDLFDGCDLALSKRAWARLQPLD